MGSDDAATWSGPATGEVVYLYAFDIAYDLRRQPLELERLLGVPIERARVEASKRHPSHLPYAVQAQVRPPALLVEGPGGVVSATVTMKVLPVGALAIAVRVPVTTATLEDLVTYHDLRAHGVALDERVRAVAAQALDELRPWCIGAVDTPSLEEPYTVFCLDPPARPAFDALAWFERERARVAALLTQEPAPALLSRQEIDESTARALSYYRYDLAVIDWDASLIIDDPSVFDQSLWVLELANVQLTELEAYDRILDAATERAYADLRQSGPSRTGTLRQIAELRIDLARVSDELQNIGKLYGDWHLARVHQAISARLHLVEWYRTIEAKLTTLDELYQFLKQDRMNRWMLALEIMVVLLFIVDLVVVVLLR